MSNTGNNNSNNGSFNYGPYTIPQQQTIQYYPGQYYTIVVGGSSSSCESTAETESEEKKKDPGCSCKKCKEYYPYAEMDEFNTINGKFVCWGCRHF